MIRKVRSPSSGRARARSVSTLRSSVVAGVALFAGAALATACSSSSSSSNGGGTSPPPPAGGCAADETPLADGSCQAPGVPASRCGHGFRTDGNGGCDAILPANDCPDGQMALPGDTACKSVGAVEPPKCSGALMALPGEPACRAIADCGAAPWGAIPVDATTQYVDATYAGGASDGSPAKPWTTIAAGVSAAASGAIVAIAAGRYAESLALDGKPVKLWGRCADKVEIATSANVAAISIAPAAAKSEVHGVAITGDGIGVAIASGANDIVLDSLWIHGTTQIGVDAFAPFALRASLIDGAHGRGVRVQAAAATIDRTVVRNVDPAPTDLRLGQGIVSADVGLNLSASVVENCHGPAVLSALADLTVVGSVVRDTQASADTGNYGEGIEVEAGLTDPRTITIRDSTIARSRTFGIYVRNNATLLVERTLVRGTLSRLSTNDNGGGIEIRAEHDASTRVTVNAIVRGSLFEKNRTTGVSVTSAHLVLEDSVVRDTVTTESNGTEGFGVTVNSTIIHADATIRRSLIERNRSAALLLQGGDGVVEDTLLRRTFTDDATKTTGYGMQVGPDAKGIQTATLVMRSSVVDDNFTGGVVVFSSKATLDACVVRATKARVSDGGGGRGVVLERDTIATAKRASLTMTDSLVAESLEAGITLDGADATIDTTRIRDTRGLAGASSFGDGVALEGGSSLALTSSRIERVARAGVASFGSSVTLTKSGLLCNAIDLDGDADLNGAAYTFDLQKDNACGCGKATHACQVLSTNLAPPRPLGK